jgi:hypothetical protein
LDGLASQSVQKHVQRTMERKAAFIKEVDRSTKILKKEQTQLISKGQRDDLNSAFKASLSVYIQELKAQGVNLSSVESALNYKTLHGSGGAAESTRGLLAYYLAVLKQIHSAKNEVFSAIIIDTPNQQEQADFNYEIILDFLMKRTPENAQLILCAMNRSEIKKYKESAHVILLDEAKLLLHDKYLEFRNTLIF